MASTTVVAKPGSLGLWSATSLVIGHTIAVGIFLTPAELIGTLRSPALTFGMWLGCGGLVLAGAFTFGELASRYPWAGGPYVYLRQGWGRRIAFLYGWQSLLIMDPGILAALATGAREYMVLLWPEVGAADRVLAIALIWILAIVSMTGLRLSARVISVMTIVKMAAFAAVVLAAFAFGTGSWSSFTPFVSRQSAPMPLAEATALGLVAVFFSFGGFWEASRIANEVRHASRTMPAALAIGVGCVTLVYVATTVAFIYLVPLDKAATATEFARRAGEAMLGQSGPSVFASIVLLSVASSALAMLIMAPRLYVAMGQDGVFPSALVSINPSTHAPVRATLLLAVLASVFALAGTFQQIVTFFMCTTLAFVALAAGALIVVRRREGSGTPAFSSPGYPFTPLLFVGLVTAVVALVAFHRPFEAISGFVVVLLGLPAYEIFARRGMS